MDYTSIKVGQLPTEEISGSDFIPHEVNGLLKKATITDLAAFIGANDAVGFRAVSVPNGGTLPTTDTQEFILVGPGTYNNVGGGSTITVTEELNALVSNGTYWFVGVEIPIDAPPGNAVWGEIVGTLSNQTDLQSLLNLKADLVAGKVPSSQLPSYVDDVVEVADFAALPVSGETGKIYVTLDSGFIYRWTGTIYVRIADEAAAWGTITGTLSDQTDLQSALNLRVPYTGATGNVDLGSHKLTASDLVVNHSSGSGTAASITKGGNGEALTVVKSSGTGNAASITGGTTLISELNLTTDLADAYIASAATWNAKQDALNGTGFVKISGSTISYDNSTYALDSVVVKLTGNQSISGKKSFNLVQTGYNLSLITSDIFSDGIIESNNGMLRLVNNTTSADLFRLESDGIVFAKAFKKDGGTSSEFLMADGSVTTGGLSGTTNYIPKFTSSSSIGNSLIYEIGSTIGIGTTSPFSALHINRNASELLRITRGSVSDFSFDLGASNDLYIKNNGIGTTPLTILSSGNIGINEMTPSVKLQIAQTASGTTNNIIQLITTSDGGKGLYQGFDITNRRFYWRKNDSNDYNFAWQNADGVSMKIINSDGFTKMSNNGSYYGAGQYHEFNTNVSNQNIAILTHTNASNPYGPWINFPSDPNNSSNYFLYCGTSGTARVVLNSNGGIKNYQANNVNLSDERTKKDIIPLESYWDKFKAIEIVKFKYKDQTHDDFNIGVIAQQVESVAPEFIDVDGWNEKPELDEEGNEIVSEEEPLKSVYTADLYHATIKVLQEAMQKIEIMEAEIELLKAK